MKLDLFFCFIVLHRAVAILPTVLPSNFIRTNQNSTVDRINGSTALISGDTSSFGAFRKLSSQISKKQTALAGFSKSALLAFAGSAAAVIEHGDQDNLTRILSPQVITTGVGHTSNGTNSHDRWALHANISVTPSNLTRTPVLQSVASEKLWRLFNESFWDVDENSTIAMTKFLNGVGNLLNTQIYTIVQIEEMANDLALGLPADDEIVRGLRSFLKFHSQRDAVRNCGTKVVGYYTSWGNKEVTQETLSYATHLIYAFPSMGPNGTLWLDAESAARLRRLLDLRGSSDYPKIMISVGGAGRADECGQVVRDDFAFRNFSLNLKSIIDQFGLDGIDFDWEGPANWNDKTMYVKFMRRLRKLLDRWKVAMKKAHLFLTFAGPAGVEQLHDGYDLKGLLEGDTVDWVNVMTYDYYGPWGGAAGIYTGPPAPLFDDAPKNYSRRLNVHWTVEKYLCETNMPNKLVLGIPFYGRFWNNVSAPIGIEGMWRKIQTTEAEGGLALFYNTQSHYLDMGFMPHYNERAQASCAWNKVENSYLGYESPQSAELKTEYALRNKLGGIMIWALDYDDDNLTMLKAVTHGSLCNPWNLTVEKVKFNCYEKRWWSADDGIKSGMCGPLAPLINDTFYAVCDPDDVRYPCCGKWGYCGAGPEYCDCAGCTNYGRHPELISQRPGKPSVSPRWFTLESENRGKCGYGAPMLEGSIPTCNPDDSTGPCCSAFGVCGNEKESCTCESCVDFRKTPDYHFAPPPAVLTKQWWTWDDGPEKAGQCGPTAPNFNASMAICDPRSENAYCCSPFGYCGGTSDFCTCKGCRDYRTPGSLNNTSSG